MTKFIENMTRQELLEEIAKQEKTLKESVEDSDDWRDARNALHRLRDALHYVGDSGLTSKKKLEQGIAEVKYTRKWKRTSINGQYGKIPVYESGEYEIRSIGGTFFVYRNDTMEGMCDKLGKAKAFVEFLDGKLKKNAPVGR